MKINKRIRMAVGGFVAAAAMAITGCSSAADVTDQNMDTAAENFELLRSVVFVNTIADTYMLRIEGYCNVDPKSGRVMVTCMTDEDEFVRHAIYSGDNTAVVVQQLEPADVDSFHYRFIFRPETVVPDFDVSTSEDLTPAEVAAQDTQP